MHAFCPIQFHPLFKRYLWGGRRLGERLGKPLGEGNDYAESWEVVDRLREQSVVANGDFAGLTFAELLATNSPAIMGNSTCGPDGRFPLLFKFLDANLDLSVQVHPNDVQAATLPQPDRGKTEAWVVLEARPGAVLYAGLKAGTTLEQFRFALEQGTAAAHLHAIEPQVGDCIFLPAGTIHALGAGLLVAEIQQASDTTFRLFDWNRVDAAGRPRELHIEQGLSVANPDCRPLDCQASVPLPLPGRTRFVECDYFVLERWIWEQPGTIEADGYCHLMSVVEGRLEWRDSAGQWHALGRGQTALIPAIGDHFAVRPVPLATTLWITVR